MTYPLGHVMCVGSTVMEIEHDDRAHDRQGAHDHDEGEINAYRRETSNA